jgi:hypothetical protein
VHDIRRLDFENDRDALGQVRWPSPMCLRNSMTACW